MIHPVRIAKDHKRIGARVKRILCLKKPPQNRSDTQKRKIISGHQLAADDLTFRRDADCEILPPLAHHLAEDLIVVANVLVHRVRHRRYRPWVLCITIKLAHLRQRDHLLRISNRQ